MCNRAVLLVAVLAIALPAIADQPSQPNQKNAHRLAPKTTAPKSPKNLKGPNSGSPVEHVSSTFGKENVANLSGRAGAGSSQGIKHKHKPANNGNNVKENVAPPK
jgi:hypothetical protein